MNNITNCEISSVSVQQQEQCTSSVEATARDHNNLSDLSSSQVHDLSNKHQFEKLMKEHNELYQHFARTFTDLATAKSRISVYEQALKQILSAADLDKVMSIAQTRATQQREHTIAMHNWSDLVYLDINNLD